MKTKSEMASPLVHIGFPKAGSTFLQKRVFIESNGFHAPWSISSADAVEAFIISDGYTFAPEQALSLFKSGMEEAEQKGLRAVISHEYLTGNAFNRDREYYGYEVSDRILRTFPDAKILLLVREQVSMILSTYQQYVVQGGWYDLSKYLGEGPRRPGFASQFNRDFLRYDHVIDRYQSLFGKNSVLVLPLELLSKNSAEFLKRLSEFSGVVPIASNVNQVENAASSAFTVELRRIYNRFVDTYQDPFVNSYRIRNRVAGKIRKGSERFVPREWQERKAKANHEEVVRVIGDYYSRGNSLASEKIGIDLKSFGYQ
ncbi:MAG: hypothetical protein CL917_08500 [Deltaproteobacteria bacterium]|nr:hypothetical protein [Deltaproteobacteria bacterium]